MILIPPFELDSHAKAEKIQKARENVFENGFQDIIMYVRACLVHEDPFSGFGR